MKNLNYQQHSYKLNTGYAIISKNICTRECCSRTRGKQRTNEALLGKSKLIVVLVLALAKLLKSNTQKTKKKPTHPTENNFEESEK